jgi:hypothetical protein
MAEAVVTAKKGKINGGLWNVFKIPSFHDVHSRRLYFRVSYASFTVAFSWLKTRDFLQFHRLGQNWNPAEGMNT